MIKGCQIKPQHTNTADQDELCIIDCRKTWHTFRLEPKSIEATSDVNVKVGPKIYKCHRFILMTHSLWFQKIIMSKLNKIELTIFVPHMSMCIFEVIYVYMYTCCLQVNKTRLPELLRAAKYLQMPGLIEECNHLLDEAYNMQALVKKLEVAMKKKDHVTLGTLSIRFAKLFYKLVKTTIFLNLSPEVVAWIISIDSIEIHSEMEIFNAVTLWVKHKWLERSDCIPKLMSQVRFGLMTDDDLLECFFARRNAGFMNIHHVKELVLKGFLYHIVSETKMVDEYEELIPRNRVMFKYVSSQDTKEPVCVPLYGSTIESMHSGKKAGIVKDDSKHCTKVPKSKRMNVKTENNKTIKKSDEPATVTESEDSLQKSQVPQYELFDDALTPVKFSQTVKKKIHKKVPHEIIMIPKCIDECTDKISRNYKKKCHTLKKRPCGGTTEANNKINITLEQISHNDAVFEPDHKISKHKLTLEPTDQISENDTVLEFDDEISKSKTTTEPDNLVRKRIVTGYIPGTDAEYKSDASEYPTCLNAMDVIGRRGIKLYSCRQRTGSII